MRKVVVLSKIWRYSQTNFGDKTALFCSATPLDNYLTGQVGLRLKLALLSKIGMLMLRFQRIGRRNDPAFRIVATEKRSKPKSGFLEILGSYHPKTKDTQLKQERILYWLSKGAQASETVHNLLVSKGVVRGKKIAVKMARAVVKEAKDANVAKATKDAEEAVQEPEATKELEVKSEEAAAPAEEKKEEAISAN